MKFNVKGKIDYNSPLFKRARCSRKDAPGDFSDDEYRFFFLSWRLIEYKIYYYYPHYVLEKYHDFLEVPDWHYDSLEREYLHLCKKLHRDNTVAHWNEDVPGEGMFEVDFSRPGCRLILSKFGTPWACKEYPHECSLDRERFPQPKIKDVRASRKDDKPKYEFMR